MKDINGNILLDSEHRISYEDRMRVLYDRYIDSLARFKCYTDNGEWNLAKMEASILGQPLYDATKSGKHSTGYFTTGAVDNQLRPGEASVEHPYGRTDAAIEILYAGIREDRELSYKEFEEMIQKLCFTVHATREENRQLSIMSRADRNDNWIEVYSKAGVDLYRVPIVKQGRRKVYLFDKAEKIAWKKIKEELAY